MRQGQAKVLSADELKRVYAVVQSGNNSKRNVVLLDFSFLLGITCEGNSITPYQ